MLAKSTIATDKLSLSITISIRKNSSTSKNIEKITENNTVKNKELNKFNSKLRLSDRLNFTKYLYINSFTDKFLTLLNLTCKFLFLENINPLTFLCSFLLPETPKLSKTESQQFSQITSITFFLLNS